MGKIPPKPNEFWITNKSNTDVSLSDLYFTIGAYRSYNLLDSRHFHYTWDQIYKSATSGSIFIKKHKIAVRHMPPSITKIITKTVDVDAAAPIKEKSIYEFKEDKFEELDLTDEEFAAQQADLLAT